MSICICRYIYVHIYIYIYSRLRRLRRLIAWVREEVESVRGKGLVRRLRAFVVRGS